MATSGVGGTVGGGLQLGVYVGISGSVVFSCSVNSAEEDFCCRTWSWGGGAVREQRGAGGGRQP